MITSTTGRLQQKASRAAAWASLLIAATVILVQFGVFGCFVAECLASFGAAVDGRNSIARTLSQTIASRGITAAVQQYRELKAAAPHAYNFEEAELNRLGYQLLRAKRFADASAVFRLNVEAYPRSSNTYDSLAEAYLKAGDTAQAITNYEKAVELNPRNRGAVEALRKLGATSAAPHRVRQTLRWKLAHRVANLFFTALTRPEPQ